MTKHYPIGPSSLSRIFACPGSLKLSEGKGSESSKYATEGTMAHELAAEMIGGAFTTDPNPYPDGMMDHCGAYAAFCREQLMSKPHSVKWVEHTLESKTVEGLGGTPDLFGTYVEGEDEILHVIDFKYGAGVRVGVEQNPQLLAYLLLADEHTQVKPGELFTYDKYRASIFQPRTPGEPGETMEYSASQLIQFARELEQALGPRRSEEFHAGDHCGWCPSLTSCDHLNQIALKSAQASFDDVSDTSWVKLLKYKSAIKKLLDEIPKRMVTAMQEGKHFPGWKLVEGQGNRAWQDDDVTVLKRLAKKKIGKKIATTQKLKSPPQLEREGYGDEIAEMYHRPVLGPTLAPESDKRPAIEFETPAETFSEVPTENLSFLE